MKHKKNVGAIVHSRGVTFRVWAPFASSVSVNYGSSIAWQNAPLNSEDDGYWSAQVKDAVAGQEYQFVITNGDKIIVKNDPRALYVTSASGNGVIVDLEFDWEGDDFTIPPIEQQIIYELHIGSFNRIDHATEGNFQTATEKLDHLAQLGVNMIELMPIAGMLHDHGWGYAPEYIYAVESNYGGRHGLLEFVKAAHQRGIGVIVDVVYNHFSPEDSQALWRFDGWYENDGGGIYFYNDWRGHTPWGVRPDFGRPEVRQFLLDNARYWLHDCHLDGIRVDSTLFTRNVYGRHSEPDTDLPEAWSFMQELNTLAHKIKPSALMVGEDVAENEYITKPTSEAGAGFDTQWQVTMPHTFRQALAPTNTSDIDLSPLLGEMARAYNDNAFEQVIYFDSHDSAANGAARLTEEIDAGKPHSTRALAKSLVGTGILLTSPGIPMLFMGQEFAQGGSFNDWQPLEWQLVDKYSGYLDAYKHLIDLRKNMHGHSAGLTGKNINISHVDDDNKVIAYHRWNQGGPRDDVFIIVNLGHRTHKEYVLGWPRNGQWIPRFNSSWNGYYNQFKNIDVPEVSVEAGTGNVILPPTSILIFSQDK